MTRIEWIVAACMACVMFVATASIPNPPLPESKPSFAYYHYQQFINANRYGE